LEKEEEEPIPSKELPVVEVP
jgi:hypothetical protein